MGSYFGGVRPKFFLQKLSNIARFQFKNERDRRRTHGVTGVYFSVFILTQHGIKETFGNGVPGKLFPGGEKKVSRAETKSMAETKRHSKTT